MKDIVVNTNAVVMVQTTVMTMKVLLEFGGEKLPFVWKLYKNKNLLQK